MPRVSCTIHKKVKDYRQLILLNGIAKFDWILKLLILYVASIKLSTEDHRTKVYIRFILTELISSARLLYPNSSLRPGRVGQFNL